MQFSKLVNYSIIISTNEPVQIFDFVLSDEDIETLNGLDLNKGIFVGRIRALYVVISFNSFSHLYFFSLSLSLPPFLSLFCLCISLFLSVYLSLPLSLSHLLFLFI